MSDYRSRAVVNSSPPNSTSSSINGVSASSSPRRASRRYNYQLLIDLVKRNPAIFDNKHEMYRNRLYIHNVWQEIAQQLGCSDKTCREKWANLRSNYMREMRKLKLKQLEGSPFRVTWNYFHAMSFLDDFYKRSIMEAIVGSSPTSQHDDDERLVIDLSQDHSMYKNDDEEEQEVESKSRSYANEMEDQEEFADSGTEHLDVRKRKLDNCSGSTSEMGHLHEMVRSLKMMAENSAAFTKDSDKLFLLSLLPSMKRLCPDDNLLFRSEVHQLIQKRLNIVDRRSFTSKLNRKKASELRYASIRNYTAANGKVLKDKTTRSP